LDHGQKEGATDFVGIFIDVSIANDYILIDQAVHMLLHKAKSSYPRICKVQAEE
jgi:hypothetical protein